MPRQKKGPKSVASKKKFSPSVKFRSSGKRGKGPKGGKKEERVHGGKNKLLRSPAKECLSCNQTTHCYERDMAPKVVYVKWVKTYISCTTGHPTPQGNECWFCYDTRRRFFTDC